MAAENNINPTLIGRVEEHLREKLRSGEMPTGSKLPSMRQLSVDLGCSLGIVQMAINTLAAEGYLRSLPRQGVFASEPPNGKCDVALVLPSVPLEPMGGIIHGVRQGLIGTDLQLLVQASDNSSVDDLDQRSLAGVVICPPTARAYADPLKRFLARGIPCVQATSRLDGLDMNTVCSDGFESGRVAAQHLLDNGHTRIGLIGFDADSHTGIDVIDGVHSAIQKHGIQADALPRCQYDTVPLNPDEPWRNAQLACIEFFRKHTGMSALLASGHDPAIGAFRAAKTLGIGIPDPLSLLAIGSDLQAFTLIEPPMSVVDNALEVVCERAVIRLRQLIDGDQGPVTTIQLPPRLIERGSVRNLNP